jgi:hypothetical protein
VNRLNLLNLRAIVLCMTVSVGTLLLGNFAAAAVPPRANSPIGVTTQQHVINAYQRALAVAKPNALKNAVNELRKDIDGTGLVGEPTAQNVLFLENGRGGSGNYSGEVLLAVPVTLDSTGLVGSTGVLVRAKYAVKMGQTVTVTLKEIVELKSAK